MTDWHSDLLTPQTRTDKDYRNTQNVRRLFKKHLGEDFHFTRPFMLWIKTQEGATLQEIMDEWKSNYAGHKE